MEYTFPAPQLAHFAEFYFFEKIFLPHEVDKILALWQEEEKVDGMMSSGSETPVDESLRKSNTSQRWFSTVVHQDFSALFFASLQRFHSIYLFCLFHKQKFIK